MVNDPVLMLMFLFILIGCVSIVNALVKKSRKNKRN